MKPRRPHRWLALAALPLLAASARAGSCRAFGIVKVVCFNDQCGTGRKPPLCVKVQGDLFGILGVERSRGSRA
jgi:hypothetical protein